MMWPGTFSKAAGVMRRGGTAMFALLALGGDLGCSLGPTAVGFVSGALNDELRLGILAAAAFPTILLVCVWRGRRI
jgi:MFS-type transporter involved in bile tolerance (Atg22 family)